MMYEYRNIITQQAGKSVDHIARWPTTACLYSSDDDCVRPYSGMSVERGGRSGGWSPDIDYQASMVQRVARRPTRRRAHAYRSNWKQTFMT